jgi:hypothetical protein
VLIAHRYPDLPDLPVVGELEIHAHHLLPQHGAIRGVPVHEHPRGHPLGHWVELYGVHLERADGAPRLLVVGSGRRAPAPGVCGRIGGNEPGIILDIFRRQGDEAIDIPLAQRRDVAPDHLCLMPLLLTEGPVESGGHRRDQLIERKRFAQEIRELLLVHLSVRDRPRRTRDHRDGLGQRQQRTQRRDGIPRGAGEQIAYDQVDRLLMDDA